MSDNQHEDHSEPSPEEKEKEQKINKEIEKLKFFLEDAQESYEDDDYDELKTVLNKCNTIYDKLNELITNLQELKLEVGNSTTRSDKWKKSLKSSYTPLVETKLELQRSLDKGQREESETATEECLQLKHKKEEEIRRMMHEREKELLEEKTKAELKLTEKMEMETERHERQRRTKLLELKNTPFKRTPSDWIRFKNMFISQNDKSEP